jgi:hypothetical protein
VLGADCALAAPAAPAPVGTQVSIVGSGFPADADVAVTLTKEGVAPTYLTAQSDASGSFVLNLLWGDVGSTTVTAAVATFCTAKAVFVVTAPSAGTPPATSAPSPSATPSPTLAPSAAPGTVVPSPRGTTAAVATGPAGTARPSRSLAPTNAAPGTPDQGQALPSMSIFLGCLLLLIGVAGWIGQRTVGSRN